MIGRKESVFSFQDTVFLPFKLVAGFYHVPGVFSHSLFTKLVLLSSLRAGLRKESTNLMNLGIMK